VTVQERHAHYFLSLAEDVEPHLTSSEREVWLRQLEADHENLRVGLTWLIDHHEGRLVCRMAGALRWFWNFQGGVSEGRRWPERGLNSPGANAATAERVSALSTGGHMAWLQGDHETARRWLDEAVSIARTQDDRRHLAYALIHLGLIPGGAGNSQRVSFDDGLVLCRDFGDNWWAAVALQGSGIMSLGRGDHATARARLEESVALWQQVGDTWLTAQALNGLGDLARSEAEHDTETALYTRSLALLRQHGITSSVASVLHNLGYVAHHQANDRRALELFLEGLELFGNRGDQRGIAECLVRAAVSMLGLHQPLQAARLFGTGGAVVDSIGGTQCPINCGECQQGRQCVGRDRDGLLPSAARTEAEDRTQPMVQ
jgi:tetratricopeptide (TPR) repeat protein